MDMPENSLTDEQRKLLSTVARLSDKEGFEELSPELESNEDTGGLTEKQRVHLEVSGKLADAAAFNSTDAMLDEAEDGLVISDAERWIIEQNKFLLTPEQAKEQFLEDDEELAKTRQQQIEFKPFVESERLSTETIDSAELDEIAAPQVSYEDYKPVGPPGVDPGSQRIRRGEPKGLIGRVSYAWGKLPTYSRAVRKQLMRPEKIIGPIIFCSLALGLFILPGYLKKTFNESEAEALGLQQVRAAVADELDEEVPDALDDPDVAGAVANEQETMPGIAGGGSSNAGGGVSGGTGGIPGSDAALNQARVLANQGWTKRATAMYRTYLALNPRAFKVRIELIKFLMNAKEKGTRLQARIECLEALKMSPPFEQTQEVASLYKHLQTD